MLDVERTLGVLKF